MSSTLIEKVRITASSQYLHLRATSPKRDAPKASPMENPTMNDEIK